MKKLGMLGMGTVGRGVGKILTHPQQRDPLLQTLGIKSIAVSSLTKPRAPGKELPPHFQYTEDPNAVVTDPDVDIVVEVMGKIEPTYSLLLKAIQNGKHVVTANKSLIAAHGSQLLAAAADRGVQIRFEAAVAGGIPVIQALNQSLGANQIQSITGIINGTTNYILTLMTDQNKGYEEALQEAQAKGYAEDPPDFDVSGRDAAEKLAILSAIGLGKAVDINYVLEHCTVGIHHTVSHLDIQYARQLGYRIKLLATSELQSNENLLLHIGPSLVANDHPLASVNDAYNAVFIQGDPVEDLMFYGRGAGEGPTASAIVADIINVVKTCDTRNPITSSPLSSVDFVNKPSSDLYRSYYLRILLDGIERGVGGITTLLEKFMIIPSIIRKETDSEGNPEIIVITQASSGSVIAAAARTINSLPYVKQVGSPFPILCTQ